MNPKSRGGRERVLFSFFFFLSLTFFFPFLFRPRSRESRRGGREGEKKKERGGGREVDKVESVNYKPATGYPGRKVDPQS